MHIAKYPFIFDQKKAFFLFKRSRAFFPSSSVHTYFPALSQENLTTANHTHQRTTTDWMPFMTAFWMNLKLG
jgi:hypothetical protein